MATKSDSETNGYTFLWIIENFDCWLMRRKRIVSPSFIADAFEDTIWSLRLYPNGNECENFVSLFLSREMDFCGPNTIEINYHLIFLNKDGSFREGKTVLGSSFTSRECKGFKTFEAREKVFGTERESFLSGDTLRVQCTIWKNDEKSIKFKHLSARTAVKVNRRSFIWRIEKFSFLNHGLKNLVKDDLIDFYLVLYEGLHFEKKMGVEVISLDETMKYFSLRTSIIDSEGKEESCGIFEYSAVDLKKGVLSIPVFTKKVMENKSRYLKNDVLSLNCEYASSSGIVLYERFSCEIMSPEVSKVAVRNGNKHFVEKKKSQLMPVLADDLKSMYNDKIFWDTELRTSTQTFQAHKSILSARSPVFMNMFKNDMKEKNSGQVDITDLEDDTIQRMLTYIYTDSLEGMQFDSACKLYQAADKYDILSMKRRCSSFLKENLCPDKTCDILVLTDLYQDEDLNCAVQDYILEHDREVFGTTEWKTFVDSNPKLAAVVMYRKVFPK